MTAAASPFAPFRRRTFAILWTGALLANTGTWLRDVANGWTMTELSPSPVMVALVQAAMTLPVFLFSMPAGALSDIVDRRWLLLLIQIFLAGVSLTLAATLAFGFMTPGVLLALTFAGGVGLALMGPPWQAAVPELVPHEELRAAVALNSLGVNVARAIGPAIGGLVLALSGAVLAYLLDALSYVAMIIALLLWRRTPAKTDLKESFGPALVSGVRYVLASGDMRRVLVRAAAFFLFASAYWALLPLVARESLTGDASLYGVMLGAIGAGAVTGALILPVVSRRFGPNAIVFGGTVLTAGSMAALGAATSSVLAISALFVAGLAWIAVLTTLNVVTQSVLPNWVRSRGLAVYLMIFFGSTSLGSVLWGQVAVIADVPSSLLIAAACAVLAAILSSLLKLPAGNDDLTPFHGWAIPDQVASEGPVQVEIVYHVRPRDQKAFLAAVKQLGKIRTRDGATHWRIEQDPADAQLFVETFRSPTWRDHLRQHERFTRADAKVQSLVNGFHAGPAAPEVRHIVPPEKSSAT